MNIKSLFVGSVAALAAVSDVRAADAIVAAEPESVEYVRVCDAFGKGFFYIPGTETCLKIGGYIRFQGDWQSGYFDGTSDVPSGYSVGTRGLVTISARNDTEFGALASTITMRAMHGFSDGGTDFELDEGFFTLAGFRVGYGYNYWDNDLSGETDDIGSNRLNQIGYEYEGSAFSAGIFADQLTGTYSKDTATDWYAGSGGWNTDSSNIGIEAQVSGSLGPVKAFLLGSYDFTADNFAVRAIVSAEVGPGTFSVAGVYSSGINAYYDVSKWTIAAEYAATINDKLTLTPGFQYFNTLDADDVTGDFIGGRDAWRAGLTVDYEIVSDLAAKVSVQYQDEDGADDHFFGLVRLQRDF